MIIINFKNYKSGKDVLSLAKKIEKFSKKFITCVPAFYLSEISKKTSLKVFAQHVDKETSEKSTGFLTIESAKKDGASGSLLNHSEHKLDFKKIKDTITISKKLKFNLVVCVSNINEAKKILKLNPFAIAYEDPSLISTKNSITSSNKKQIINFVKLFKNKKTIPLCGAGINSSEDYTESLKLGCKGILVSSIVANNSHPDIFLNSVKHLI